MAVKCPFFFVLKIIVSLHILKLEFSFFVAGISLLLLPLENARRDFIWSFEVLYKHQCLKHLYSYLQLRFFRKLPAISSKLEFKLRVCTKALILFSLILCQICMDLSGSCILFNLRKKYVFKSELWQPHQSTWVKFKLYLSSAVFIEFLTLTLTALKISLHYIIKVYLCIKECIYEGDWEIRSTLSQVIKFIEVLERPSWS